MRDCGRLPNGCCWAAQVVYAWRYVPPYVISTSSETQAVLTVYSVCKVYCAVYTVPGRVLFRGALVDEHVSQEGAQSGPQRLQERSEVIPKQSLAVIADPPESFPAKVTQVRRHASWTTL